MPLTHGDLSVGVDVGATNTRAAVVDPQATILATANRLTPRGHKEGILESILAAIQDALAVTGVERDRIAGVGVGIVGGVDIHSGMSTRSANLGVAAIPVRLTVERALGLPCWLENDVRAATIGELMFGAGQAFKHFVLLSVGTGIATGLVCNGRIYRGAGSLAGEFGHTTVDLHGAPCHCGQRGCLETYVSGPAIAAQARALAAHHPQSTLAALLERGAGALNATAVFHAAAQGDTLGLRILDQVSHYLGAGIVNLYNLLDPEAIILGGGVFAQGDVLFERLAREVEREYSGLTPRRLALSRLGPAQVGVIGAASLVRYFTEVEPLSR